MSAYQELKELYKDVKRAYDEAPRGRRESDSPFACWIDSPQNASLATFIVNTADPIATKLFAKLGKHVDLPFNKYVHPDYHGRIAHWLDTFEIEMLECCEDSSKAFNQMYDRWSNYE